MTDRNLSLLSNIIANKLVWESVSHFDKAASLDESYTLQGTNIHKKIWGVGISVHNFSKILEFFVPHNFDTSRLRYAVRKFDIGLRFIRTQGIHSYFATNLKPSIITGNPVRHYRLNGWGALGGYVNDNLSNYRLAISNNHVFGLSNAASINDSIEYDTGVNVINLGGFFRKVDFFTPPSINIVDAAVSWIRDNATLKWVRRKPTRSILPLRGMEVYKIGVTTGYTEGFITNINFKHRVRYPGIGVLNFGSSLIIIGKDGYPFSLPGDSGSLVFNKKTHEVVGMIFAGDGTYSFANIFKNIEALLQISI